MGLGWGVCYGGRWRGDRGVRKGVKGALVGVVIEARDAVRCGGRVGDGERRGVERSVGGQKGEREACDVRIWWWRGLLGERVDGWRGGLKSVGNVCCSVWQDSSRSREDGWQRRGLYSPEEGRGAGEGEVFRW